MTSHPTRRSICDRVKSSTVAICRQQADGSLEPFGSGINVGASGLVVTARHVIEGALVGEAFPPPPAPADGWRSVTLRIPDLLVVFTIVEEGRVSLATCRSDLIHGSHLLDFAVMRLKPDEPLPFLDLGDSDVVCEGDPVLTCGFPLGVDLQPTSASGSPVPAGSVFSDGIIAGIRPHSVAPREMFLLDMTINDGNSGGPLVDEVTGELVGIVYASWEVSCQIDKARTVGVPTGIGLAVPINRAKEHITTARDMTERDVERLTRRAQQKS